MSITEFMAAVGGDMQPFQGAVWDEDVTVAARRRPHEGCLRTYRVEYQSGAESGRVTLRTHAQVTTTLVTQARALLEAHGIEGNLRRIVMVGD